VYILSAALSWIIYCHTHTPTGRRYIGRTSRPLMVRWKEHAREARDGRGNLPLHTAILESGEASFRHEVLETFGEADKSLALDAELRWIEHYQTTDPAKGFNRIGTGKKHEGHAMKFQDRVVGLVRLPGSRILPAPKNFRTHGASQRDAMRGVLADVGISGTAVVWVPDPIAQGDLTSIPRGDDEAFREWFKRYRGDFQLIDGHLRAEEIRDQGLPCVVLDVDEREAAELLATFDPIGALAGFDKARYVSLAADFNSTNSAVQQLVADMAQMEAKRKAEAESVVPPLKDDPDRGDTEEVEPEHDPSEGTQTLEELEGEFGAEAAESLFWPEIRVKVPKDVLGRWEARMKQYNDDKRHEAVEQMLTAVGA